MSELQTIIKKFEDIVDLYAWRIKKVNEKYDTFLTSLDIKLF